MTQANDIIQSLGVESEVLSNNAAFIRAVRTGVPGNVVKSVIKTFNNRELIARVLNISTANLSRIYRVKHMDRTVSEEVLDMIRLYGQAIDVFGSKEIAIEWIKSPVPALSGDIPESLLDTFTGRKWVSDVLRKIEYGEFS